MNGFSTVDGFVEITESLSEMIKYMANEPSVGLFYIQQHAQNAIPNVVNLNNHVVEKSREVLSHTEDLEDSLSMVRSMKECGSPIADAMMKDIRNSLTIMSTKQPKRGLIRSPASSFQMRRSSSWGPIAWGQGSGKGQQDGSNYFSTVIKSARQKASNFRWPQIEPKEQIQTEPQKPLSYPAPQLSVASASTSSSVIDTEGDELPLSSQVTDELHEGEKKEEATEDVKPLDHSILLFSENYEDFKADKEVKLEQWLEGTEGKMDRNEGESNTGRVLT